MADSVAAVAMDVERALPTKAANWLGAQDVEHREDVVCGCHNDPVRADERVERVDEAFASFDRPGRFSGREVDCRQSTAMVGEPPRSGCLSWSGREGG